MGILDGLLDALLGGGDSTGDVNSILAATTANAAALGNVAAANADTLIDGVIGGLTGMVGSGLETTFAGVQALEESALAASAEAMNSAAGTAIGFTETTYRMRYIGSYDSPSHQRTVQETLSHDGGARIMTAYASHTLAPLMEGIGDGSAGLMAGVGLGAGRAMANLGGHLPDRLPALAHALGGQIAVSLGSAGLLANNSL